MTERKAGASAKAKAKGKEEADPCGVTARKTKATASAMAG
jgi:hypothetical protein